MADNTYEILPIMGPNYLYGNRAYSIIKTRTSFYTSEVDPANNGLGLVLLYENVAQGQTSGDSIYWPSDRRIKVRTDVIGRDDNGQEVVGSGYSITDFINPENGLNPGSTARKELISDPWIPISPDVRTYDITIKRISYSQPLMSWDYNVGIVGLCARYWKVW